MMKITYVGGGGFRVLPEVRELLKHHNISHKARIVLYDKNAERGEAMAALLRQVPEMALAEAEVSFTMDLDKALEGADFVEITACPWNWDNYGESHKFCLSMGWLGSDNLSPNGAFLALRGGPVALDIARRMERLAPQGVMIVFSNPIAILTSLVNRATSIRAVGVCAGQQNYIHNISYMMKWDEYNWNIVAEVAGINHFSWIMRLTLDGEDFIPVLDRKYKEGLDWDWMRRIANYDHLRLSFPREIYAWQTFGAMLYSCEPDGLPHLCFYDEEVERMRSKGPPPATQAAGGGNPRAERIAEFLRLAGSALPPSFWTDDCPNYLAMTHYNGATPVRLMRGLMGDHDEEVATSYLNNGAVEGFPDDAVMEYTTRFTKGAIGKKSAWRLPPATVGVTRALVEHQTLVAEAIAAQSRETFLHGLYAYPMCRSREKVEKFVKGMVEINREELPDFVL